MKTILGWLGLILIRKSVLDEIRSSEESYSKEYSFAIKTKDTESALYNLGVRHGLRWSRNMITGYYKEIPR